MAGKVALYKCTHALRLLLDCIFLYIILYIIINEEEYELQQDCL